MISPYKIPGIIFAISSVMIIIGISVGVLWTTIFHKLLLHELVLSPTSKTFQMWKETPIPMYMKVHLFNWTNPHEFYNGANTKPNFVEMGPYVFREIDYKVNNVWNDNDTLTFQQRRTWIFEKSMTVGSLDDLVTNVNPVAATVAFSIRKEANLVKKIVSGILSRFKETLVVTKTVRELLFDGYKDELLIFAVKTKFTKLPFQRFGWFYGRNGSDVFDGTFNILRGSKNIHDLGKVVEWNYSKRAERYYGQCDIIQGSVGDLWPPIVKNKTVSIFASDICTHLQLTFDNSSDYLDLNGYKYISDETMLDNGTNVPSRKCYCHGGDCQPSGIMNVSSCKYDAPVFVSLPHFYLADESYRNSISGMNPNKKDHEFSLILEPKSGIPMQVRAQLQINVLVQPDNEISLYKNVSKTYIPMLWFRQEANLTSNYANEVKFLLILPVLGHVTFFGVGGIGTLLFFLGIFICSRKKWQHEDNQVLLKE